MGEDKVHFNHGIYIQPSYPTPQTTPHHPVVHTGPSHLFHGSLAPLHPYIPTQSTNIYPSHGQFLTETVTLPSATRASDESLNGVRSVKRRKTAPNEFQEIFSQNTTSDALESNSSLVESTENFPNLHLGDYIEDLLRIEANKAENFSATDRSYSTDQPLEYSENAEPALAPYSQFGQHNPSLGVNHWSYPDLAPASQESIGMYDAFSIQHDEAPPPALPLSHISEVEKFTLLNKELEITADINKFMVIGKFYADNPSFSKEYIGKMTKIKGNTVRRYIERYAAMDIGATRKKMEEKYGGQKTEIIINFGKEVQAAAQNKKFELINKFISKYSEFEQKHIAVATHMPESTINLYVQKIKAADITFAMQKMEKKYGAQGVQIITEFGGEVKSAPKNTRLELVRKFLLNNPKFKQSDVAIVTDIPNSTISDYISRYEAMDPVFIMQKMEKKYGEEAIKIIFEFGKNVTTFPKDVQLKLTREFLLNNAYFKKADVATMIGMPSRTLRKYIKKCNENDASSIRKKMVKKYGEEAEKIIFNFKENAANLSKEDKLISIVDFHKNNPRFNFEDIAFATDMSIYKVKMCLK